ncbi:MAG: GldG family protein [Oscillospiraceae bacterium]|nr:GldG family protein [Oscillospiraceae bacterium]
MSIRGRIINYLDLKRNKRIIRDSRSGSLKRYAIGSVLVLLGIVIVVNLLVGMLASDFQLDWTATQVTSISPETEKVLSELPVDVRIYGLFEKPDNVQNSIYQLFIPMLEKYEDASKGKLTVQYVDPDTSPSLIAGLDPTGLTAFSKDTFVIKAGERISVVDPYNCLAYDAFEYTANNRRVVVGNRIEMVFTGEISYLTSGDLQKVYFLKGHQEFGNSYVASILKYEGYDCYDMYLAETPEIPEDCDLIVLNLPRQDISEDEAAILGNYLKTGGKMIVACDFVSVNEPMDRLNELVGTMGLSLTTDLILEYSPEYLFSPDDNKNARGIVSTEYADLFGIYYAVVGRSRHVRINDIANGSLSIRPIITSSALATINPYGVIDEKQTSQGIYNYAVRSTSSDPGYSGDMIVLGTGYLSGDEYLNGMSAAEENIRFFSNLILSLTGREIETPIPPKSIPSYAFTSLPPVAQQTLWSVILIAIIPFLFISAGIIVYYRRRHQ